MNLCTLEITPRGPENINETEFPECSSEMRETTELDPHQFRLRNLHPHILIGTASDRYAGWVGQINSEGRYKKCLKCAKVLRMP